MSKRQHTCILAHHESPVVVAAGLLVLAPGTCDMLSSVADDTNTKSLCH
jgi:hypothetical protein